MSAGVNAYGVTYTVPRAGTYDVDVTVNGGQRISACHPPVHRPEFRFRQYDGLRVFNQALKYMWNRKSGAGCEVEFVQCNSAVPVISRLFGSRATSIV